MMTLVEHIPPHPPNFRSRVLNALWREIYPDRLLVERPENWEPDPVVVSTFRLDVVQGLGLTGRMCVEAWIKECLARSDYGREG